VKEILFAGDSRERLRDFPLQARKKAGFQLQRVQLGLEPEDWKPMRSVGAGVREIRIWDEAGTFRVIYIAKLADGIVVLHAFKKKTQAMSRKDADLAKARLKSLGA
jgi:phage-related protein